MFIKDKAWSFNNTSLRGQWIMQQIINKKNSFTLRIVSALEIPIWEQILRIKNARKKNQKEEEH